MNAALRFAFRSLRRTPGFTVMAIAILTLGIGAITAMFSITNTVVFKPLAYRDPGQLASLMLHVPAFAKFGDKIPLNAYHYEFFKKHSHTLKQIGLVGPAAAILSGAGKPVALQGARVTPNLFDLLGVQPRLGRGFLPQEAEESKNQVVILSDALWHQRFDANPHVLGRKIRLNDRPFQVVGIMASSFPFPGGRQLSDVELLPEHAQYWIPMAFDKEELAAAGADMRYMGLIRLKPGISLAQAHAELSAEEQEIVKALPTPIDMQLLLEPLRSSITGEVRQPLLFLFGAVGLVLLIVCINLMNLMLTRSSARRREWAVRLAMGAGLRQLLRDTFAESLMLSLTGGVLGCLLAAWLVALVRAEAPVELPRVDELHLSIEGLAFALGASIFSALLFGLWPAWRSTKIDPQEALQSSSRTRTEGPTGHRLGRALVAAEVALSIVVLLGAGLLLHSFVRVLNVNPGVQVPHLVTANLLFPPGDYKKSDQIHAFYRRLLDRANAMPDVQQAGITTELPLTASDFNNPMTAADRPIPPVTEWPIANIVWASASYFRAGDIPLKEGRLFRESDGNRHVAVISENLAERLWPHESAVGHLLKEFPPGNKQEPYRVIGVVGLVHGASLTKQAKNMVYRPYWQEQRSGMALVVRTSGDIRAAASAIRSVVDQIDSRVSVSHIRPMQDLVDDSVAQRRFQLYILIAFAGMALLLACLGIYGVLSFQVGRRTGEIGIRMALGAQPEQIRRVMLRQGMVPVVAGLVVGVAVSAALGRVVQNLLFGIEPLDPATYIGASGTLVCAGLLACLLPAGRAARLNPLEALRNE